MCRLRRKLLLFDYIIGKLVEWQAKRDFVQLSVNETNEILSTFKGKRLMKLVYFICLEDTLLVKENNDDFSVEDTLFGTFDNHVAMPAGPAENTLYSNRSILFRFDFSTGELRVANSFTDQIKYNYSGVTEDDYATALDNDRRKNLLHNQLVSLDNNNRNEINLLRLTEKIDNSIEALKKLNQFPFDDTEKLVNITHSLPLWNKFIREENKAFNLNNQNLSEEVSKFRNILN
nr:MAG TPA: hypothetical protein [Caudoviricetes sp.]